MDRGTTAVGTFAEAAVRHRDLTERQLHVLRMVAAGRTNWEIGEALGITIDGAKWHVSELLTKLGLSSREELTGYWRWHNRPGARLGRTFRGLLALPAFKVAGAVAGAATRLVWPSLRGWQLAAPITGFSARPPVRTRGAGHRR